MASNIMASGSGPATVTFERPVTYVTFGIQGATIGVSVDSGVTYVILGTGNHSFFVGPTQEIMINGAGRWQLLAVVA